MKWIITQKPLTPEWLLKKGFVITIPGASDPPYNIGSWDWDYPVNDGDLCFIEKEFDRKQFAIILSPNEYQNGEKYFDFTIFIRNDAGCGFVAIPNQFTEMTEYYFSLLYEAIRREKL